MAGKKTEKIEETQIKNVDYKEIADNLLERVNKLEKIFDNQPETPKTEVAVHQNATDHITNCPNCADEIKKKYAERQETNQECSNCHYRVLKTEKYCPSCGDKLDEETN